jgi:hypothetical protein
MVGCDHSPHTSESAVARQGAVGNRLTAARRTFLQPANIPTRRNIQLAGVSRRGPSEHACFKEDLCISRLVVFFAACFLAATQLPHREPIAKPLSEKEKNNRDQDLPWELSAYQTWETTDVAYIITDQERAALHLGRITKNATFLSSNSGCGAILLRTPRRTTSRKNIIAGSLMPTSVSPQV